MSITHGINLIHLVVSTDIEPGPLKKVLWTRYTWF